MLLVSSRMRFFMHQATLGMPSDNRFQIGESSA